ncbi:MAG: DUF3418 domain-containing protein, partial [Betaproteobacteria bacterium]|nr:DUF3418 domain-containing protein [Betaproteobacteria bacterium]
QLFIREALVAGDWQTPWPFLANNLKLVRKIEELEHKARRQDVLVDDELIAAFYNEHLPDTVVGAASFDAWYRDAVRAQPKLLFLSRDELMRHEAAGITTEAFPKSLRVAGLDLALSYVFEPGSPKDGVTVTVPLYALNQLPEQRLDWLVPGLLKEKVLALLKSLPQKPRARLVPLPEFAQQFVDGVAFGEGPLLDALRAAVRHKTQLDLKASDFKLDALPAHLLFNLRVVAADGHQLGTGRSLARLRAELGEEARGAFQALAGLRQVITDTSKGTAKESPKNAGELAEPLASITPSGRQSVAQIAPAAAQTAAAPLQHLPDTPLPELMEIARGKQTLLGYPALADRGTHVELEVFDTADEAAAAHRQGLRRLLSTALKEPLRHAQKSLPDFTRAALDFMALGSADDLAAQIVQVALDRAFLQPPLPATRAEFDRRVEDGKPRLQLVAQEIGRLAAQTLTEYAAVQRKLGGIKSHKAVADDIASQLQALMPPRFIDSTPYAQLQHYPRYLKAIQLRIDKLRGDPARDAQRMAEMSPLLQRLRRELQQRKGAPDARLDELRWLIEELRVSLFAQELRTPLPVSVKRVHKALEQLNA